MYTKINGVEFEAREYTPYISDGGMNVILYIYTDSVDSVIEAAGEKAKIEVGDIFMVNDMKIERATIYWENGRSACEARFELYSIVETIQSMQESIADFGRRIKDLEEEVFPTELVSFDMSLTSLIETQLDLCDEDGNILEKAAFVTGVCEAEPVTFQTKLHNGTYYLKNQDNYALGKPNGDLQPLVADGGTHYDIGSVEIVMIQPPKETKKK